MGKAGCIITLLKREKEREREGERVVGHVTPFLDKILFLSLSLSQKKPRVFNSPALKTSTSGVGGGGA